MANHPLDQNLVLLTQTLRTMRAIELQVLIAVWKGGEKLGQSRLSARIEQLVDELAEPVRPP